MFIVNVVNRAHQFFYLFHSLYNVIVVRAVLNVVDRPS